MRERVRGSGGTSGVEMWGADIKMLNFVEVDEDKERTDSWDHVGAYFVCFVCPDVRLISCV